MQKNLRITEKSVGNIRIGIVEFLWHHIFLYSLALITNKTGAEVTIFTTKSLYNLIVPLLKDAINNYKWILKNDDEDIVSFFKRIEHISNQEIDLLFVNTLQIGYSLQIGWRDLFRYTFFKPKCKSILVTGRATEWFEVKYKLLSLKNLKNTIKDASFLFKYLFFNPKFKSTIALDHTIEWAEIKYRLSSLKNLKNAFRDTVEYYLRRRILRKYNAIVVHTRSLRDYVVSKNYKKDVFIIPFALYKEIENEKENTSEIKFIVIGAIADWRRDYYNLLISFENLFYRYKDKISLVLLGRPVGDYGKRIIDYGNLLKQKGFKIKLYNEYISETTFATEIHLSDVIINPIRLDNYELGGLTAGVVEAIRYAKPGIYPSEYVVPEEIISSSLFYDDINKLPELLEKYLINDKSSLKTLTQNALVNARCFYLEKVTKDFEESVMKWYRNNV